VLEGAEGDTLEVAVNLAYPVGDLVLLGMVAGGVALTGWKPGVTWSALAASFVLFGISDGLYLVANANGTWQAGSVFEAGWPAATLLLAWAAWMRPHDVRPRPLDGRRNLIVPIAFALLGLTLLISDHFARLNLLAVALAWASVLAVIGRFAMTFFANLSMLDHSRREALTDPLTGLGNPDGCCATSRTRWRAARPRPRRSCSSTSTASRPTTTPSATRRAMRC
jgi:hypothetical protein